MGTPIVNMPQSAILGMHATKVRPVVRGGAIVARPVMYVALTYDHRIIDGREAVLFLRKIKECVEDPKQILFDLWAKSLDKIWRKSLKILLILREEFFLRNSGSQFLYLRVYRQSLSRPNQACFRVKERLVYSTTCSLSVLKRVSNPSQTFTSPQTLFNQTFSKLL